LKVNNKGVLQVVKVRTTLADLTETVVLSALVKFDVDGIAEVEDEDVLAVLKEVGEANGTFILLEPEVELDPDQEVDSDLKIDADIEVDPDLKIDEDIEADLDLKMDADIEVDPDLKVDSNPAKDPQKKDKQKPNKNLKTKK
jgi:hypothetical protein